LSKEIAQTVKSKRIVALVAILAAFAVFATLGSQWRGANAVLATTTAGTATTAASPQNPGAAVATLYSQPFTASGPVTVVDEKLIMEINGIDTANLAALAGANVSCANTSGGANITWVGTYASGTATCTGTPTSTQQAAAGTYTIALINVNVMPGTDNVVNAATSRICTDAVVTLACSNETAGNVVAGGALSNVNINVPTVVSNGGSVAAGMNATMVLQLPIGSTYCSDNDGNGSRSAPVAGDVVLGGTASPTLVSVTGQLNATTLTENATIVARATAAGSITASIKTHAAASTSGPGDCLTSAAAATATVVVAELRHVDTQTGAVVTVQDVPNNVIGYQHKVCATDGAGNGVTIPLNQLSQIAETNGGGYHVPGDFTPDFTNPTIFTQTVGTSTATCFSWTSTAPGDQQMSVIYQGADGNPYTVNWDTNNDGNGLGASPSNDAITKEWNVLETSRITIGTTQQLDPLTGAPLQTVTGSITGTYNPAVGNYTFSAKVVKDDFLGSHTTRTGDAVTFYRIPLQGVAYHVVVSGTCVTNLSSPIDGVSSGYPTTTGVSLSFNSGSLGCGIGSTVILTITGTAPGPLGSSGNIVVNETVTLTVTGTIATKQVFLAWAGQRVILEHDWRVGPGDSDLTVGDHVWLDPNDHSKGYVLRTSICPVTQGQYVTYIRGGGPGNFIPALGANVWGNDSATVQLTDVLVTDDSTTNPQDGCISRVLYESEDQGEVDVEAFIGGDSGSKIAFVVYYMKIENVAVSLVSQVSKPTHNSSIDGLNDYDPGNPWDASKDVTTVDWNVSRDLLVRGRVKGWFVNSNPSGRAADTTNPLNALPANRWVMPDDWDLLAGGPHGEEVYGTAESFRPEYDIMFAPNNLSGIALSSPAGTGYDAITTVGASTVACPNGTSWFKVTSGAYIVKGLAVIRLGTDTTDYTVSTANFGLGCSNTSYIKVGVTGNPLLYVPVAGTIVYLKVGVPFEGPYSLLDIPNLSSQGAGGAAPSGVPGSTSIRDTILQDGDVDWWDAPMPPALITARIRGAGFIKQVLKQDVYYIGTADSTAQNYPNAFYYSDIPDSPFIAPVVAGGGYLWDTWGPDGQGPMGQGPYNFWQAAKVGSNIFGTIDSAVSTSTSDGAELAWIRNFGYPDPTIARDLVVYSDNHGEFMVTANGDFRLDYKDCVTNALGGGKHCKQGDKVGTSSIDAVADYPDFRGKHFPVASNAATVTWTWGGYKDVTIEKGESDQYKYVVFHALDRDGFCDAWGSAYAESLHPVLSNAPGGNDAYNFTNAVGVTSYRPAETVDFLIDSGDGIIISTSSNTSTYTPVNQLGNRQFAPGVTTYDLAYATATGSVAKVFPAINASKNECQAWVKVSNSLLGVTNVLTIAHDDEGDIGIDKIVDLQSTMSYSLTFRWSLVTWAGANNVGPSDALKGTGAAAGGNDILAQVTAVYGWDQAAQAWLAFFPSGVNVPGANDLTKLVDGNAYWVAITAPGPVTWTIATNVG
jgi:hypothetical protein